MKGENRSIPHGAESRHLSTISLRAESQHYHGRLKKTHKEVLTYVFSYTHNRCEKIAGKIISLIRNITTSNTLNLD